MLQVSVCWYVSPCDCNDDAMMTVVVVMKMVIIEEEGERDTGAETK
jgi:hypothetical protein